MNKNNCNKYNSIDNKDLNSIGILTDYYNSINYGGVLQAYALLHRLEEDGYVCHQINFIRAVDEFDVWINGLKARNTSSIGIMAHICEIFIYGKKSILYLGKKIIRIPLSPYIHKQTQTRVKAFKQFNQAYIPSTNPYTQSTIQQCVNDFDIFICGSDLIWSPKFPPECALSFVPDDKLKVSYAPSIGATSLTDGELLHMKQYVPRLDAISVRERDAVNLVKQVTSKKVTWVLDPTLLLTADEWARVSSPKPVNKPYAFCYILGSSKKNLKFSYDFVKMRHLTSVMTPYFSTTLYNILRNCDIIIHDAGPDHFISLIKNADYVITDSFHGTVFSILFRKKFYVLQRYKDSDRDSKNSRVNSLLYLFHLENRLIKNPETFDWNTESEIDYDAVYRILEEEREKSLAYLKNSLNLKPKGETKE